MKEEILLVDDDKLLLRSMVKLLEKENYNVSSTDNGHEALKLIGEKFFDLIVLDIRMPGIDGVEVLNKIRDLQKDKQQSNVIIITGYASEDVPIKALKLGASDYMMKPFETSEFLHSINQNIKLIRLEKEKQKYIKKLEETNQNLQKNLNELRETQQQLISAEKLAAIGQLASNVGNELCNPLKKIKKIINNFKKYAKKDDKELNEFMNTLPKEIDTINMMATHLFDFSKSKKLSRTSIPLKEFFEEIMTTLPINNKIKVKIEIQQEVKSIQVDKERMKCALCNILINAVESMPEGGTLKISAVPSQKENKDYVEITISDTGCGIKKEDIKQIYNPLFSTKKNGLGLGLGLTIVEEIIKQHHGEIKIKSETNKGTIFTILLPK